MLLFENEAGRTGNTGYLLAVVLKNYNVMIDDQNFIDQSVKWYKKVQEHQNNFYRNEDDCRTSCLLDHLYFKRIAKMLCKSILVLV